MKRTIQQEAKEFDDAIVIAIYWAKRMEDDDAVRGLVLIQRRIEQHFKWIAWNRKVMSEI